MELTSSGGPRRRLEACALLDVVSLGFECHFAEWLDVTLLSGCWRLLVFLLVVFGGCWWFLVVVSAFWICFR